MFSYHSAVFLSMLAAAASVFGQNSFIQGPQPGAALHGGRAVTLQVTRNGGLQASTEVGYVVGLVRCTSPNECPPPESSLGTVLYNNPFHPQMHMAPELPGFYENITITIPPDEWFKGVAQINALRLHLMGVARIPILESNSIQVEIV